MWCFISFDPVLAYQSQVYQGKSLKHEVSHSTENDCNDKKCEMIIGGFCGKKKSFALSISRHAKPFEPPTTDKEYNQ